MMKKKNSSKAKHILMVILSVFAFAFICKLILAVTPFPELKEFQRHRYSTRIYDRNGNIVQVLSLENGLRREFVPIAEIPRPVRKAFVEAEDSRFYFHNGIDFLAAIRAATQNRTSGSIVSGASTITMQLARMICPSPKRNFSAKLRDCFNALRLESKLTKNEILELYLNNVPFGYNVEGVSSASKTYFALSLRELDENQARILSRIPRNPNLYNPFDDESVLTERYVYPQFMPHYVNYLVRKYPDLFSKCYEVYLNADLELHFYSQNILIKALESTSDNRISNGSILVIDEKNGNVLCWIGSQKWNDKSHSGQIDGVLNRIQPGSSMKPFLYAMALENGLKPTSVLADVPKEYGEENLYIPQNFNNAYNGPIRTRVALASSLNVPAVEILHSLGVENYVNKLENLGFESLHGKTDEYGLSLALGSGEVSLLELVRAFSVFTRDGMYSELNHFDSVKCFGKYGKIKASHLVERKKSKRVYEKDTARLICAFLSDKSARSLGFGYAQTFETKYPSIFKTGTANQYQNITALGADSNYAVGVWMGNFNGNTVIGKTGSSLPASISRQILDRLELGTEFYNKETREFPLPESYHLEKICALSGCKPGPYCTQIVNEYVKNGEEIEECTFHTYKGIYLPFEYQKWQKNYSTMSEKLNYFDDSLEIEYPKNNSVFYYDDSRENINQIIPVSVIGGDDDVLAVYLDGKLFAKFERPFDFSVPLERGYHHLEIECGFQKSSVDFTVR